MEGSRDIEAKLARLADYEALNVAPYKRCFTCNFILTNANQQNAPHDACSQCHIALRCNRAECVQSTAPSCSMCLRKVCKGIGCSTVCTTCKKPLCRSCWRDFKCDRDECTKCHACRGPRYEYVMYYAENVCRPVPLRGCTECIDYWQHHDTMLQLQRTCVKCANDTPYYCTESGCDDLFCPHVNLGREKCDKHLAESGKRQKTADK